MRAPVGEALAATHDVTATTQTPFPLDEGDFIPQVFDSCPQREEFPT